MPSVEVSVWRFPEGKDGTPIGHFVRAEKSGRDSYNRACKDIAAIIAADVKVNGIPKDGYGIAMTMKASVQVLNGCAAVVQDNEKDIEILPPRPPRVPPAPPTSRN